MNRREFALSGCAVILTCGSLGAQPAVKTARVGILINGGPGPIADAIRKDFATLGYVEGQGFALEPRYAEGDLARLPALAAELVRLGVDVILALGGPAARAAQGSTTTIPVVFSIVTDPVALGLVADPERPGRNLTGLTSLDPEQAVHQIALIRSVFPRLTRLGVMSDAAIPGADDSGLAPIERQNVAAARAFAMQPLVHKVAGGASPDFAGALDAMLKESADAVLVLDVPVTFRHGGTVAALAAARRLPTIFPGGQSGAGGVITYGTSVADTWPRMALMADRIMKGAKPAEMAVETISRRELVINLKAARAVGLVIPDDVVRRADRVIE